MPSISSYNPEINPVMAFNGLLLILLWPVSEIAYYVIFPEMFIIVDISMTTYFTAAIYFRWLHAKYQEGCSTWSTMEAKVRDTLNDAPLMFFADCCFEYHQYYKLWITRKTKIIEQTVLAVPILLTMYYIVLPLTRSCVVRFSLFVFVTYTCVTLCMRDGCSAAATALQAKVQTVTQNQLGIAFKFLGRDTSTLESALLPDHLRFLPRRSLYRDHPLPGIALWSQNLR